MTFMRSPFFATILVVTTCHFVGPAAAQNSAVSTEISSAIASRDFTTARALFASSPEGSLTPASRYQYAQLLLNGTGGEVAPKEAHDQLTAAVAQGHAPSAVLLARIYLSGPSAGVERDPFKAVELLNSISSQNHPEGMYYLGILTRTGTGVTQDADAGLKLLVKAAEAGSQKAQLELIQIYSTPALNAPEQALHWLREAAKGGVTKAQFDLAGFLADDKNPNSDNAEALLWYRRAAEGGMSIAQRILGTSYLSGTPDLPANPNEALRWLNLAAQAGDPGAMNNLGIAYGGQNGIPRDDEQALSWFKKASEGGLARATYSLAQYHEAGLGTPADLKSAALLYRKALEQGDKRGAIRLGILTGQGALDAMVPKHLSLPWAHAAAETGDEGAFAWLETQAKNGMREAQTSYGILGLKRKDLAQKAAAMLTLAANAGDTKAQFELGNAYTTGNGVELDYVGAHMWLNIAATGGQSKAAENRDLIGNLMTPDQIADAQTRVRIFFETASDRLPEAVQNNRSKP